MHPEYLVKNSIEQGREEKQRNEEGREGKVKGGGEGREEDRKGEEKKMNHGITLKNANI